MKPVLSPRELGRAVGVSESSIKRWIDDGVIEASRTAGGHRRIAANEAIRFVRATRSPLVHPEILGLDELSSLTAQVPTAGTESDALFEFLKAGSALEAIGLLMSLYVRGRSMAEIIDGPVRTAMERIGVLWADDPSAIFWEHRATQIAIQAVSRLRWLVAPEGGGPIAVGGAPSGDPYQLPSLCVAAVMEAEGVEAVNLGPDTPLDTLVIAVDSIGASLVWLSLSGNGAALETIRNGLGSFAERLAERKIPLVLGGSNSSELEYPISDWIFRGSSMAELEALVKGMRLSTAEGRRGTSIRRSDSGR